MSAKNRRGAPWLYLILGLMALVLLLGWPIARQVILHRGEEVFSETDRPTSPAEVGPGTGNHDLTDEP